jgi:hypothetical protein
METSPDWVPCQDLNGGMDWPLVLGCPQGTYPLQLEMARRNATSAGWGMLGRRRVAVLCLALLITLAPSLHAFALHAFAMTPLVASLETSGHPALQVASPAGETTTFSARGHQHDDESVANNGGASDCSTLQCVDLCMAVCCVAILSQSLDHSRVLLPGETESVLTIPSSASRIASHPPPQAIA